MLRSAFSTLVLLSFVAPAAGTEAIKPTVKSTLRKPAAKNESTDRASGIRSGSCALGVVVTTGDKFTVMSTGLTVFQNKETAIPIAGWGLNELIFARIRAAIPADASVVRIQYDPAKLPSREA